jgi:anti-sigma regulatory factor (Ser/Thr protein kinase)
MNLDMQQFEPVPNGLRLELPAAHSASRMARQVVAEFARREGLDEDELGTLELVTSELLSNAVDHGGGGAAMEESELVEDVRMTLMLTIHADAWELSVSDQGGGQPQDVERFLDPEHEPDFLDERGRGFFLLLRMVDVITVVASPDGKGLLFTARRRIVQAS